MLKAAVEAPAVLVHTDSDGSVWCQAEDKLPYDSCIGPDEFAQSAILSPTSKVRIVGVSENAHLLTALFPKRAYGKIGPIEVASPMIGRNRDERADPEVMLQRMRTFAQPASVGGWHEFTALDYPSYALATCYKLGITDRLGSLLNLHPALPALEFIPHLDRAKTSQLLSIVLDPRWYVDPKNPARGGRLSKMMGLFPQAMARAREGNITCGYDERCKLVLDCWKTSGKPEFDDVTDHPGCFLWRHWMDRASDYVMADLRTSQAFLDYIRYTWLAGLYGGSAGSGQFVGDGLFVPKFFFDQDHEVEAFDAHMKATRDRAVPD